MKNRHTSEMISKNDDYYINIKKDMIIKYKYPKTEVKEIYDMDYLTWFQNGLMSLPNDSHSVRSFNSNNSYANMSNSSASSASLNTVSRSESVPNSQETFTFQDFVSSILNSHNQEHRHLIIQDIARLIELKFREFKKKLSSSKNLQQTLNTTGLHLNSDSDLFIKIAEQIFKQASEEPNGILGACIQLNLIYDNDKCVCVAESFAYDTTTMPTSEIVVNMRQDKCSVNGDSSVGGLSLIKKYLRFLHAKYFQHRFSIDSNNFDINKNRLY